ncbi:uncharacterized protein [Antedon mediterranea]|uniref:uncharacterized protein n=1 Tax=Antedon mediterranea TaxID=105859 RepID=UPI003AF9FC8F
MEHYQPTLNYEHVELNIDADHLVILYVATIKDCRMLQTIIVRTESENVSKHSEDNKPLPTACKKVLSFLQTELKVFSQSGARGLKVRMCIPCQNDHMHPISKFDKDLPCGRKKMDVTLYRKLFGEDEQTKVASDTDMAPDVTPATPNEPTSIPDLTTPLIDTVTTHPNSPKECKPIFTKENVWLAICCILGVVLIILMIKYEGLVRYLSIGGVAIALAKFIYELRKKKKSPQPQNRPSAV